MKGCSHWWQPQRSGLHRWEVSQLPLQRLLTQYLDGTLKLSLNWGTGLSLLVPVFNDYGVSEL